MRSMVEGACGGWVNCECGVWAASQRPHPPPFGRSPLPAFAGRDKKKLHKRLDAGLGAAENQSVNVVGAFVGVHRFKVREHAHHMKLF